jgi:hypothetical protein
MMPLWIKKSLLGMFSTILFFGLCEGAAQFFFAGEDSLYDGDPAYFWYLKSNMEKEVTQSGRSFVVKTNSFGLRGDEPGTTKEKWLFIGCSTTFGWGVNEEDTFVKQLGDKFGVSAINGGQPGWSTHQAVIGVDRYKSINADRVFIGFGVRDIQLSNKPDHLASPTPWIFSLRLVQMLNVKKSSSNKSHHRVDVSSFKKNLELLGKAFPTSKVLFYSFPQLEPSEAYDEVIVNLEGVLAPTLSKSSYFEDDVIHLNVDGHNRLASWFITILE